LQGGTVHPTYDAPPAAGWSAPKMLPSVSLK
jgi:hypothetical protein